MRPPGLNVDFSAVRDAVQKAWQGNGESITEVAARFGGVAGGFTSGSIRLSNVERSRLGPVDACGYPI